MRKYRLLSLFIVFTLFSLASLYFLIPGFCTEIALPYYIDNYIAVGILMHNIHAIATLNFADLYHFPIFYPYSFTLTAGVNFFGQSLLLLPFYLAGFKNIYFLYNSMIVLSLILGGFSIYYLTRDFIQNEFLSITAGAVYILHPLKQLNYPHPAMLFFPLSVLSILFLLRYLRDFKRINAVFFYVFLFWQALFSLSLFLLTSIFCLILFVIYLLIKRRICLKKVLELSFGLILLALFVFFVFYPYVSNPLEISYQEEELKRRILMPSINFYSSWFPLTFKFLRGRPYPLSLGLIASFLIFFYFYSKSESKKVKTANYFLLLLLITPFLLKFWRVIPMEYLYKVLDISFICLIAVFVINVVFVWKKISTYQKVVLGLIIFVFVNFFGAIYRYIPFEYNFLNLISNLLPQINRLRGVWRLQYYFFFLWILLAFMGAKGLFEKIKAEKKKAIIIGSVSLILLFENFPTPLRVGSLLEYHPSVKNLYQRIENYPDYYGVLELPHYKGGWNDLKIYSLMTVFHNKHIYNGYYGVGVFDTLGIFRRGYFHPAENIPDDIANEEIITYLRDNGIRIILFHRSMLVIGDLSGKDKDKKTEQTARIWAEAISGFKKAKQRGLLSKAEVVPEGIVGVIAEKNKGKGFLYQLPYYSLKSKKYIHLRVKKTKENPVNISVSLNGDTLFEDTLQEKENLLVIKVPPKRFLKAKGNQLEINASDEVLIREFSLVPN